MSLLDSISGMITPSMLGGLGQKFGVPVDKLQSSMGGITGMFMHGLAGRSSDHTTMERTSQLINESPGEHEDVSSLLDAPDDSPMKRRGNSLLGLATGGNPAGLTGMVGRFLGIGGGGAAGILGMVSALAMTSMRKLGRTTHLDASSLGSLLHSERDSYAKAIPAPLRGDLTGVRDVRGALPVHHKTSRAWWLLLAVPLLALLIWSFSAGHRHAGNRHAAQVNRPAAEAMRENAENPQPQEQARTGRPVGQHRLSSVPGSAEQQLLEAARSPDPAARAVPLDAVTFSRGSTTLDPGADSQLANVAQVLERHPNTQATITGYPDSTGNAAANQQLSQARADAVRTALVAKGIDASRIRTEAQSSQTNFPTPRMVSVQITGQP